MNERREQKKSREDIIWEKAEKIRDSRYTNFKPETQEVLKYMQIQCECHDCWLKLGEAVKKWEAAPAGKALIF